MAATRRCRPAGSPWGPARAAAWFCCGVSAETRCSTALSCRFESACLHAEALWLSSISFVRHSHSVYTSAMFFWVDVPALKLQACQVTCSV